MKNMWRDMRDRSQQNMAQKPWQNLPQSSPQGQASSGAAHIVWGSGSSSVSAESNRSSPGSQQGASQQLNSFMRVPCSPASSEHSHSGEIVAVQPNSSSNSEYFQAGDYDSTQQQMAMVPLQSAISPPAGLPMVNINSTPHGDSGQDMVPMLDGRSLGTGFGPVASSTSPGADWRQGGYSTYSASEAAFGPAELSAAPPPHQQQAIAYPVFQQSSSWSASDAVLPPVLPQHPTPLHPPPMQAPAPPQAALQQLQQLQHLQQLAPQQSSQPLQQQLQQLQQLQHSQLQPQPQPQPHAQPQFPGQFGVPGRPQGDYYFAEADVVSQQLARGHGQADPYARPPTSSPLSPVPEMATEPSSPGSGVVPVSVAVAKKERPRPPKSKRRQGKLLAELVFQAQDGTDEERENAERLFLEETSQDPLLSDYAWKVLKCLRSEAAQRRARGEAGPSLQLAPPSSLPVGPVT